MTEKINVAEILKNKPVGTKLYSSACGKCELKQVDDNSFKVSFYNSKFGFMSGGEGTFNKFGNLYDDAECVIFPSKNMRNWHKFAWKKGDVLVSNDKRINVIFVKFVDDNYTVFEGAHYLKDGSYDANTYVSIIDSLETRNYSLQDKDAAHTYVGTICGKFAGKLNMETLKIEKSQLKFKEGDIIKMVWGDDNEYSGIGIFKKYDASEQKFSTYVFINEDFDECITWNNEGHLLCNSILTEATEEEKQRLFDILADRGKRWDAKKKAVVDLKSEVKLNPFDRVLVRNDKEDQWSANIFSYQVRDNMYYCLGENYWRYCIPYIGNESLLGTTKDVEG